MGFSLKAFLHNASQLPHGVATDVINPGHIVDQINSRIAAQPSSPLPTGASGPSSEPDLPPLTVDFNSSPNGKTTPFFTTSGVPYGNPSGQDIQLNKAGLIPGGPSGVLPQYNALPYSMKDEMYRYPKQSLLSIIGRQ